MRVPAGGHTENKGVRVENGGGRGDERIPVGVVGTGGMGGMHADCLHRKVAGARVTAVSDVDAEKAGKVADECGAVVFGDAVDMMRDEGVEAVVIASPDPTHAELVHECLRLGKPVLCEKPLATSPEEALGIVEAEVEAGRKLVQVGFMRRYDPQHVDVKNVVASGAIGEPVLFKGWHRNARIPPGADSAWVVINAAIHDLDSARWMLETAEVEEVFVRGLNTSGGGEGQYDLQLIQLTFADGRLATIEVNVDAQFGYEVGVEVVGVSGTAHTAPPSGAVVRLDRAYAQSVEDDWLGRFEPAYTIELQQWIRSIEGGRPPAPDAWDGYASLVVAEACIASIRSGNPEGVSVPEKPALYEKEGSVAR
jgi:myo-inositol 2-dehydrogenase/D-chiro-inositol 1-dehydrogenase